MGNEYSSLPPLLMHTLTALARRMRVRFAEARLNLTPEQYALLDVLARHEELTLSELADMLDKDKSAVLRQADHFEQEGVVTRVADPEDRRKKTLVLTEEGRRLHTKADSLVVAIMRESMQALPAQDIRTFQGLLTAMKDSIQATAPEVSVGDRQGAMKQEDKP